MTSVGFKQVYHDTIAPKLPRLSGNGRRALHDHASYTRSKATWTTGSTGVANGAALKAEHRDVKDARRLLSALGRGDVDAYHRACRDTPRSRHLQPQREGDLLTSFVNRAHLLVDKADGNALHHAIRARPGLGKEACIAMLLRDGVSAGVRDSKGFTPLMRLVQDPRDVPSLTHLLGALTRLDTDCGATMLHVDRINVMDGSKSVLHYAIQAGNLPAVRALVGAGANVNQASTNRSPVTIARSAGHQDIVKFLQMKGGKDSASLAGQAIRPSWSLTSLDTYAQTRRKRALESADPAPRALVAEPYGTWESTDPDFIENVVG